MARPTISTLQAEIAGLRQVIAASGADLNGACIMLMREHLAEVGIEATFADDVAALAADEIRTLRVHVARLTSQRDTARRMLERDRTGLAAAIEHMVQAAAGRTWLLEGRGPYEWDDEQYRAEAGWALQEIIDLGHTALSDSGGRVNMAWGVPEAVDPDLRRLTEERDQAKRLADAALYHYRTFGPEVIEGSGWVIRCVCGTTVAGNWPRAAEHQFNRHIAQAAGNPVAEE